MCDESMALVPAVIFYEFGYKVKLKIRVISFSFVYFNASIPLDRGLMCFTRAVYWNSEYGSTHAETVMTSMLAVNMYLLYIQSCISHCSTIPLLCVTLGSN